MNQNKAGHDQGSFWRKCVMVSATTMGTIVLLWFFWAAGSALLLIFSAFLVAVALDGLARILTRITGIRRHGSVVLVVLILATLIALGATLGTMNVSAQAPRLQNQIAKSIDALQTKLRQYHITENLLSEPSDLKGHTIKNQTPIGERLSRELSNALTVTLSSLVELFIVAIIGLYLALSPGIYYRGLLRLFPPSRQSHVNIIVEESVDAVRRWLTGRALSMLLVGLGSTIGLWLIGIQFPILLGALAGALTFIPYLGALVSAVPALLVAGLQGLWPMIYVAILYLALHTAEGYVLAPLIQRRAASIAPAFLLSAQVIGGAIGGVMGIALAAPIALVLTVIIQLSYVQGVIGEEPHLPSRHSYPVEH